jgi:hypothetical protein
MLSLLDALSKIAEVVIGAATFILGVYVLLYQKHKDKKTDSNTAHLNEQNRKLQWFKELIVQPNMRAIEDCYINLKTIDAKIISSKLTDSDRIDIAAFVKAESSRLWKVFMDVVMQVDKDFFLELKANLDMLADGITEAIFNDTLDLHQPLIYEKEIGSKISDSKKKLFAQIYNYKGLSQANTTAPSSFK